MKKNSKYWQKRFEQIEDSSNRTASQVAIDVDDMFQKAEREIEKEISVWYQRFATNNDISLEDAKKWLKDSELKELKWDVQEYIKYGEENALNASWMKELENASAKYHISRLEALQLRTRQTIEALYNNEEKVINTMVKQVYSDGYYQSMYEIQKGYNIGWDIGTIDQKKLQRIVSKPWATDGKNFSDRLWQSKGQLIQELHNELTRSCILGKAPDDAIKNIAKKFNTSKAQAGRLVMTEQAYFSSVAQQDVFNELDVEQYEIVATLDDRTSDICSSMDGERFNMKDYEPGVTAPPFHPNCRTTTVPAFDDEFDIGERAARGEDGKTYYVPANMTYNEWKKSFVDKKDDNSTIDEKINLLLEKKRQLELKKAELEIKEDLATPITKTESLMSETKEFSKSDYKTLINSEVKTLSENQKITTAEENIIYAQQTGYVATGNSFSINKILRSEGIDGLNYKQKETYNALSNVINKNTIQSDILAVRRVNLQYIDSMFDFNLNEALNNDKLVDEMRKYIGTTKIEKGFMSCSLNENKMIDGNVELNVYIPKGHKGFITKNYEESEIILNHNTKYKIHDVSEITNEYGESTLLLDIEIL